MTSVKLPGRPHRQSQPLRRQLPKPVYSPLPAAVTSRTVSTTAHTKGRKISDATKLSRFIRERGFTSQSISENTGLSTRILTDFYSGKRYPGPDHVVKLCRFLKCNPWDILE